MDSNLFYELAAKILTGEASENEKQVFKKSLQEPEYLKLFEWLKREWQKELKFQSDEFSIDRGLEKLRLKIAFSNHAEQKKQKQLIQFRQVAKIAASFIIVLGIGVLGYHFIQPKKKETSITYISHITHSGEKKLVRLPDGSNVQLNAETSIKYPEYFTGNNRNVELAGEAFFEVARNPEKPFIVHSGNFATTVLGTTFNVLCSNDKSIEVTVESGKVKVASLSTNTNVVLEKGDHAVFNENQGQFVKIKVETRYFTDWHKNILRFGEIPAKEAIRMIEQWYNVSIRCESESVLKRKIRAVYVNEPLENVINDLQFMIGFEYRYENDSTIIIY